MRNFYQHLKLLTYPCTNSRISTSGKWNPLTNTLKVGVFMFSVCVIAVLLTNTAVAQAPADSSSIIGKVVCGYQGWFSATGDGSPIDRWTHWPPTNAPQPGVAPNPNPNLTFDADPDVSIYNPASLFQTNFATLGNGNPAKLFSPYKQDVTIKHFEYDAQPSWVSSTDIKNNVTTYGSTVGNPTCATFPGNPHLGQYSLRVRGNDRNATTFNIYFRVWDVNIPVTTSTDLSFWTFPIDALGRFISVNLAMTDASTLSASGAIDDGEISMHPATGN